MLALQGDFEAHAQGDWNARARNRSRARPPRSSPSVDGLVIPGGESTTMLKLLQL